jgi:Family of unknown function (DUF6454)
VFAGRHPSIVAHLAIIAMASAAVDGHVGGAHQDSGSSVAERMMRLTRDTPWTLVSTLRLSFRTFHPQGLVKIGDHLFVSSVEVRVPARRFATPVKGYDRGPGEGVGHLFKVGANGSLVTDVTLGEGSIYHPGGIDFDGTSIWVPVAEYRPNSRSIVYRVDPATMTATRVFAVDDHIGAVVRDTDTNTLHGVSWGSRRFYRWRLDSAGRAIDADAPPDTLRTLNPSHYVDYQDCKFAGRQRMICSGVTDIRQRADATPFRLGGLELIDLRDGRPLHQVPLLLWTPSGLDMTHNPVWLETSATGIRGYFLPEDETSTLYVYQAELK